MSPSISVCIPVYGTERSLLSCLKSVAGQEPLDSGGIEIIVVNDASPHLDTGIDSCSKIVSLFQQTSPWPVQYFEHDENKGILEARRTAIAAATGKYIFCLDSDDTLPPTALKTLYYYGIKSNSDIVHGRGRAVVNPEMGCTFEAQEEAFLIERAQYRANASFLGTLQDEAILQSVLVNNSQNTFLWGKLIRREIYQQALNLIPSVYCSMADDLLQYILIAHLAHSYLGIEEVVYNYTINTGISSHSKINNLERWAQACSAASVFTVLLYCIEDLEPPFSSEQIDAIHDLCRFYLINNLKQLQLFVIPELYQQAHELLKEFWGDDFVQEAEQVILHKIDSNGKR